MPSRDRASEGSRPGKTIARPRPRPARCGSAFIYWSAFNDIAGAGVARARQSPCLSSAECETAWPRHAGRAQRPPMRMRVCSKDPLCSKLR